MTTKLLLKKGFAVLAALAIIAPVQMSLASDEPGFQPDKSTTALLITDPQNDFMSEEGAAWGLVKDNVLRLDTNNHISELITSAKQNQMEVFVSPHSYLSHDDHWHERGPIQALMNSIKMFHVEGAQGYQNIEGTGTDFHHSVKDQILDGKTIISSPHKIYGPDSNDLVLQLRKRGIETVLLGGFAANLCTDSHMRELMEQGFNVVVIKDAVGAPGEEAYQAALLNYGMIANAVWSTDEAVAFMN